MIKIEINSDIQIFNNGEEIVVSQKKLRAILAFFVIEKNVERDTLASMFFDDNKNPIRNSIYMINKTLGIDIISNMSRNTLALNNKHQYDIKVDYKDFLCDLKLKNERFFNWKHTKTASEYYVNQKLLSTVYYGILNNESTHYLINGKNGVGKTEFVSRLYDSTDIRKARIKCTQSEQNFSFNILSIALSYLNNYENKDFSKVFTDINYNDKKAFKDENNLLNLYYLPITELLIKVLDEELSQKYLIIIEDIEYIDTDSLDLINKIIESDIKNISFVMTYNTTSTREIDVSAQVKQYIISNWNLTQVKNYIDFYYPKYNSHAKTIYEYTNGNPFYIEVMVNNLAYSNNLSLSRDYLSETFNCLSEVEIEILNYISCFNGSVFLENIYKLFLVDESIIINLKNLNILETRNVNDEEKAYFKHSILKEYTYNNLDVEEKKQFHLLIASQIEDTIKKDVLIKIYEVYYHYLNAGHIVKSTEYKIRYLSLVSSYTHAVFPLSNSFNFITGETEMGNRLRDEIAELENIFNSNIILKTNKRILIDFYTLKNRFDVITGEDNNTKDNILNQINLCRATDNEDELVKSYYIMIYHGLNIGDHHLIDEYLNYLNEIFPIDANPITKRIKGYNYILKREYHKSVFTLNEAVELSHKLPKELAEVNLVACYAYLGEAHIITHDYKRALKDLQRGEKIVNASYNYISGGILIKLFTAISHYRLGDNNIALQYITSAYKTYDKNDLSWKRCSCYLYARQIYKDCNLDYTIFDNKIRQCTIKYHSDLGKWLYNEFLKETR